MLLDGNNTLLVSFGSQDKDGYIMKLDLAGLLQTMAVVNDCVHPVEQTRSVRRRK